MASFFLLFLAVIFLSSAVVSAQAGSNGPIFGPGISPQIPVRVTEAPPGGERDLNYVFTNNTAAPVSQFPLLQCPPNTLELSIESPPFSLAAGESRAIQMTVADLPGGAASGDTVVCNIGDQLILFEVVEAPLIVEIPGLQQGLIISDLTIANMVNLLPRSTSSEIELFDIDFQNNLILDATIDSITFRLDLGFGITGHEFSIASLSADLGVVSISNLIAFGTPFDPTSMVLLGGPKVFVTNRTGIEIRIGGVSIEGLFIYENTKWTHPFLNAADALDAIQTPDYKFGALLSIEGETPSGIRLSGRAGFCADPNQVKQIKKRSFFTAACDDDPANKFVFESLSVSNITVAGFTISRTTEFRPLDPISTTWTIRFLALDNISVTTRASFDGFFMTGGFTSASFTILNDNFSILLLVNSAFSLSQVALSATIPFDPASLSFSASITPGTGITSAGVTTLIPLMGLGNLIAVASFGSGVGGTLQFQSASFLLSTQQDFLTLRTTALFTPTGLLLARFNIDFNF
jgi:hypothetical protein